MVANLLCCGCYWECVGRWACIRCYLLTPPDLMHTPHVHSPESSCEPLPSNAAVVTVSRDRSVAWTSSEVVMPKLTVSRNTHTHTNTHVYTHLHMLWLCNSPSGLMYDNTPGWLQPAVWLTVSLGKYTSIFNHEIDIGNLHFDEESFGLFLCYEKDGTFRSHNLSLRGTQSSFFTVKHEHDLFKNKHDLKILRDSSSQCQEDHNLLKLLFASVSLFLTLLSRGLSLVSCFHIHLISFALWVRWL